MRLHPDTDLEHKVITVPATFLSTKMAELFSVFLERLQCQELDIYSIFYGPQIMKGPN